LSLAASVFHEFVKFGLILSCAKAVHEGLKLLLVFLKPAQRIGLIGVKRGVATRGIAAVKRF
jgi:hypothetical protein